MASHELWDNNRKIGLIQLWYSSESGGQNCAKTYNYLPGAVYTMVNLQVDDNDNRQFDGTDRESHDHDTYEYYAGASYRNNTNGHCVNYGGTVSGQGYFKTWGSELRNCG